MDHINPNFISQDCKALIVSTKMSRTDRLKAMELIVDDAYLQVIQEQDANQVIKYLAHVAEDEALWTMSGDTTLDEVERDLVQEALIKRALSRKLLSGWGAPHFCAVSACARYCAEDVDKKNHARHRCRYHWNG